MGRRRRREFAASARWAARAFPSPNWDLAARRWAICSARWRMTVAQATLAAAEEPAASAITTPRPFTASVCRNGAWAMRLRASQGYRSVHQGGPFAGAGRRARWTKTSLRHGYATPMPFEPVYDYSYDAVMRSFEESLQRLGLSRIDILYIHDIGRLTHGDDNTARMDELTKGGGLKALEELRAGGAISGFGMGVNEVAGLPGGDGPCRPGCDPAGGALHLLEQTPLDDLFPACEAAGTAIVVGGPYNSGILAVGTNTGAPLYYNYEPAPQEIVEKVRRIEAVCARHGVPLAAAALQFPLAHGLVASVIPGLRFARACRSKPSPCIATPFVGCSGRSCGMKGCCARTHPSRAERVRSAPDFCC